jgi:hypothetical protein
MPELVTRRGDHQSNYKKFLCRYDGDLLHTTGGMWCCGYDWHFGWYPVPPCPVTPGGPTIYIPSLAYHLRLPQGTHTTWVYGDWCYSKDNAGNRVYELPPGAVVDDPPYAPVWYGCTACLNGNPGEIVLGPGCRYVIFGGHEQGVNALPGHLDLAAQYKKGYKSHKQTCEYATCYGCDDCTPLPLQNTPCCNGSTPGIEEAHSTQLNTFGFAGQVMSVPIKEVIYAGGQYPYDMIIYSNLDAPWTYDIDCLSTYSRVIGHQGGFCDEDPPVPGLDTEVESCCTDQVDSGNVYTWRFEIGHTYLTNIGFCYIIFDLSYEPCHGQVDCETEDRCDPNINLCDGVVPAIIPTGNCFEAVTIECNTGCLDRLYPNECVSCKSRRHLSLGLVLATPSDW